MPLSIVVAGSMIKISGSTYNHKEYFKGLGGKWESKTKSWMIPNAENREKELNEYIKKNKKVKVRRCGFCGEPGHNRTKCEAYAEQLNKERIASATKIGSKFEMLKNTPHCMCSYEEVEQCKTVWRLPVICRNCHLWCCAKARPNPAHPNNPFDFVCPNHGSSMENFLNDTRGT
jgi:hypothetical protein